MKKSIILIFTILVITIVACEPDNKQGSEAEKSELSPPPTTSKTSNDEAELSKAAVCLWPKVGLRSAPGRGKDAEYLTTIYFGEQVTLTGDKKEKDERTYLKVMLSDGSEGWSDEYLFGVGGEIAVATGTLPLYKRPDLATMQGKNFKKGDLLVLKPTKNKWREAVGFEKKHEGWVQDNSSISDQQEDILVCMLYQRAMNTEKPSDKKKQLETILSNPNLASSDFVYLVRKAINNSVEEKEEEIPDVDIKDNELFIIATKLNVRSAPTIEAENVVFQVEKGNVVTIVKKADDRENVNGMEDYWYKISIEGQEGWIFGYHTSKRIGL